MERKVTPGPPRTLTGAFSDLCNLPALDPHQHPALQSDTGSSKSDAPLMLTSSTASEIRRHSDTRRSRDAQDRIRPNLDALHAAGHSHAKALSAEDQDFNAPFHSCPSLPDLGIDAAGSYSPALFRRTAGHLRDISPSYAHLQVSPSGGDLEFCDPPPENAMFATVPYPGTAGEEKKTSATPAPEILDKKSGRRRATGLFKVKIERDDAILPTLIENLARPDLETFLRKELSCRSLDYDPGLPYPRHPNTSRDWFARNLHCTTCTDECCAVCGRACCAYRAAVFALKTHKDNPESLHRVQLRLAQIAVLDPYGREVPTFLQCTRGPEMGCGKVVCPDCCGVCSNQFCQDIQCRKCKQDPWGECLWHDMDMTGRAL